MDRDLWSGLAVFATIVEAGSFARAAVQLGLSASALSHAMRTLEAKLGVRLLDRTTRSLAPTAAGTLLLQRLRPAMDTVEEVLGQLDEGRQRPAGHIRISAHRSAALFVVLPRLAGFAAEFPDISVELVVQDGLVDIVAERFDCGIRHQSELQGDMISIRISGPVPLAFVAAPDYLRDRPVPRVPAELEGHRCLCYRYTSSGTIHRWGFEHDGTPFQQVVQGSFVTNDVDVMRDGAVAGLGVACLPLPHVTRQLAEGALVEVLAGWAPILPPNDLYYPSRRQPSAAFRAFADALAPLRQAHDQPSAPPARWR